MVSNSASEETRVLLADVVEVSASLAADARRSAKVSLLADFLSGLPAAQVPVAVSVPSKTSEQADTIETVRELFRAQTGEDPP